MAKSTIERKCLKGHNKSEGRCSSRCLRWYPRIERPTTDDGRRRFDYLGGYRTRTAARAALDAALRQRRDTTTADPRHDSPARPAGPTLDELLDRWLAHLHTTNAIRLRTLGRYRQLLEQHVRPYLGKHPISSLGTLHIQQLYDQLARDGRRDGKPGGLHPRTIRQVHQCLHLALSYGMKWHGLPANVAADAEPPALPADQPTLLTREQVDVLLTAAHSDRRPWLRAFPVELDLILRTERDTPVRPEHATRAFRTFARGVGVPAHPHLLRHALASAMAAAKEPASIIAGQLRHADGGALAGRTYIHQLPETPPRVARLIEDLYGPAARRARRKIES